MGGGDLTVDSGLDLKRVALKHRRTKIVATVGPASAGLDVLGRLVHAGVDVFRLNFSHGTHEAHAAAFANIRTAAAQAGRHVAVLADLCGPKIRVGRFEGGRVTLPAGQEVVVTVRPGVIGSPSLIPSEYVALADDVKAGDRILLADGKLELAVLAVTGPDIRCMVIHGGELGDRKGMNLPGVAVSAPALTDKDRADALFAAELGVDYLALSFVRAASDVEGLKELVAAAGRYVPVIAKIEKPEALDAIAAIVEASDGIMVARGDLGVELPAEEVPIIQQELVRMARKRARPVIVATQMLESMIDNPRPTRAEVTDVASAALGSADAVMLSAETASGQFPVEAVATLDRVLRLVEGYQWAHGQFGRDDEPDARDEAHAFARAVAQLSRDLQVRAVVVPTRSGHTARVVSSQRPASPIIATADHEAMCRRLALLWGVRAEPIATEALGHLPETARDLAVRLGLATAGQHVLLVWDADPGHPASAPTITVLRA
ncbi:MAG: pyruvate kinase [Deltaproteobacteria bacterium]|nr:pyruvate kinase [Deltaproteobacteria bacterium]